MPDKLPEIPQIRRLYSPRPPAFPWEHKLRDELRVARPKTTNNLASAPGNAKLPNELMPPAENMIDHPLICFLSAESHPRPALRTKDHQAISAYPFLIRCRSQTPAPAP